MYVEQLEKFLLFEKNLLLLSTFASRLPHNLCPRGESGTSVTATSLNVTDNSNLLSTVNESSRHSAEDNEVGLPCD